MWMVTGWRVRWRVTSSAKEPTRTLAASKADRGGFPQPVTSKFWAHILSPEAGLLSFLGSGRADGGALEELTVAQGMLVK